jgi:hypothetical protein
MNLYGFVGNASPNKVDQLGLSVFVGPEIARWLAGCCLDECSPDESPRIDDVDVAIIPANFSSPDQIDDYEDFIGSLHGLHLVAGITPSSMLMTAFETTYNLSASDMHAAFDSLLGSFGGDRAFVRLFTRVHFSTCEKRRCLIIRTRYKWVKHYNSPTGWRQHTVGMDPDLGYLGRQDAQSHIVEATAAHVDEVVRENQ